MSEHEKHLSHEVCPYWLAGTLDGWLRRWLHNPESIFSGMVQSGQTVADLGCGPGYFTLPLARLVGENGRVIAVDLQEQMLGRVSSKANRAGLLPRIRLQQCTLEQLGVNEPIDFAVAFWMVHEVPDEDAFLREVCAMLKPGGKFLLVEPVVHVMAGKFQRTVEKACAAGLFPLAEPKIKISRAVLFQRPHDQIEGK
jgi:ubiquinone/menaquinone biosynthesis C-methylase UbiE